MDIRGMAAAGYETVKEEFERDFVERGAVRAVFAPVRDDETVVDR
jgi:hypothetical protein